MTSKELIEEYIKECDKDGWVEYDGKYWKPELQIIHKDLEVLEILKPHLINAGIGKYDNVSDYELLHLKLSLSGKEYNTIKEWIENETKIAECGSATTISTQADKPLIVEVKTPDEFIIYNEENKNDK